MLAQLAHDRISAIDRSDTPGEREHIAPVAVAVKQRVEEDLITFGKRVFELAKPICRSCRHVIGSDQHWQPPAGRCQKSGETDAAC